MKQVACHYAIIRFAPFVETGEFANVGVLLFAPKQRFFEFCLLGLHKHGRVTHFFEEMKPEVYKEAVRNLREELKRIRNIAQHGSLRGERTLGDSGLAYHLFKEVIRPREGLVRFSEPRIVLANNPRKKLEDLFEFYVERSFVTKEYEETALEKAVRGWLSEAKLAERFQRMNVGDSIYPVNFPFVEQKDGRAVKAIKPLFLGQDQPRKIIEHGGMWVFRLQELAQRDRMPEKVMFAIDGPGEQTSERHDAFAHIVERLQETGVSVIDRKEKSKVLSFAQPA